MAGSRRYRVFHSRYTDPGYLGTVQFTGKLVMISVNSASVITAPAGNSVVYFLVVLPLCN